VPAKPGSGNTKPGSVNTVQAIPHPRLSLTFPEDNINERPVFAEETSMIRLTRLNGVPLVINSDLIEHMEMTPDTVISLTSGQKFMVRETTEDVVELIVEFRRAVLSKMPAYCWPSRSHNEPPSPPRAFKKVPDGE
jgi:flagellar protein FlbD